MIDFKNFKIKRGPSKDLHDPRLIVEEGYWYLSTDKAELFIGIVENGTPVLKPINGELIPEVNLEGYATEDFVREAIASIEIPEVEPYDDSELRNLINSKADSVHSHEEYALAEHTHDEYLTEHQDISHLATKEELPNLDGYAKLENIPDVSKFITEIPSEYITESELENKGYLTEHQSLVGYATESYVLAEIAKAALEGNDIDLSTYATKEFVAEEINKLEIPEAYNDAELRNLINGKADSEHTHEEYSLVGHNHEEYLTAQSLEGYAKTADLFSKDYNDLTNRPELFSGSYNDLSDKPELFNGDYNSLTNKPEIPSIEGLASETYVQTEIGKINLPETDLSNYYTKEEVDALLPVEEIEEVKTKVETVLLPKVEEEIEPTVAELKAWVDANNEIQDVILTKVGEDLNTLENNIGYVKVDDRSFAEVIDETFAKKSELPNLEEYAKLEDVPSVEGLATEDFVKEEINKIEIPKIDLSNYATLAELNIGKEFITGVTVGNLKAGTQIKADMTLSDILYQILCPSTTPEQPEVPEGIIGEIITNELPLYSVDNSGSLTAAPFEIITLTEEQAAQEPTKSGFYQVVDSENNVIESGYHDLSVANQDLIYMLALPKAIKAENISVQTYSDEEKIWEDNTFELTDDISIVNGICDTYEMDISNIDTDKYTVWVSVAESVCTGSKIRYIITE